uniref:Uncharacterized protein n=1 Tax=Aegilops tauschii subsp. strangulata TaxID=200361 RepID=A0A453CWW4_AEGTS
RDHKQTNHRRRPLSRQRRSLIRTQNQAENFQAPSLRRPLQSQTPGHKPPASQPPLLRWAKPMALSLARSPHPAAAAPSLPRIPGRISQYVP